MANEMKHFLSLKDISPEQMSEIFELTIDVKRNPGKYSKSLSGKTLGMIFQKSSTRTRVSFEVGMYQLGGHALFLSSQDIQVGRGETIADTARVLSRMLDMIMARVFGHDIVVDLARFGSVPVINGLSDFSHPCQAVADYFTLYERWGSVKGRKIAYVGDGNNVCHSLLYGAAILGMHIAVAAPDGYKPDKSVVEFSSHLARQTGGSVTIVTEPSEAAKDADTIYTDVWASMGQEKEYLERKKIFGKYQVNKQLFSLAKSDALFLHCLPAHRGDEVTDDVIDSPNSAVWDEAENRLHTQKAIMLILARNHGML
ncbi:MAG TPA: ornithine carbamoyltransferase [Acidobacteriota bacterium]|nr:ornithine carbamoyltransferase [Acidobacteriota bacterium]